MTAVTKEIKYPEFPDTPVHRLRSVLYNPSWEEPQAFCDNCQSYECADDVCREDSLQFCRRCYRRLNATRIIQKRKDSS